MENVSNLQYHAVGRRKESVARVYLRPGSGAVTINDRTFENYFPNDVLKMVIRQPLQITETLDKFDVVALVDGGGNAGQAGAIRHGIARALCTFNTELRKTLKKAGLLTRDSRMKERKKYGQRGARARFQFSKR
jgi:small subunit ribosomal protein S9